MAQGIMAQEEPKVSRPPEQVGDDYWVFDFHYPMSAESDRLEEGDALTLEE